MLRAVFFDLDGTLLDTALDLGGALNALLTEKGRPTLNINEVSKHVSNGAAALIQFGFNVDENDSEYEHLRQRLLTHYKNNLANHTVAYDGIHECIEALAEHNLLWGIVTNKPAAYAEPLMEKFTFATPFCALTCPDHVEEKKPAPDALLLACEKAGCSPNDILYVGDHKRDIDCGRNAGCDTIAVSYGYIPDNDNHTEWGATHTADHASELWPIIKTYL